MLNSLFPTQKKADTLTAIFADELATKDADVARKHTQMPTNRCLQDLDHSALGHFVSTSFMI